MLAKAIDPQYHREVELIGNSGIQFLDYETTVLWANDEDEDVRDGRQGFFKIARADGERHYTRCPRSQDDGVSKHPLGESLRIFNGVWLPLPYFAVGDLPVRPDNWARARIVELPQVSPDEAQLGGRRYRVVLAFDTAEEAVAGRIQHAVTPRDINAGLTFGLQWEQGGETFLRQLSPGGKPWVRDWVCKAFLAVTERPRGRRPGCGTDEKPELAAEAHYLNVLGFLGRFVKPHPIKMISATSQVRTPVDVSLILDVGNSRSCGLLTETDTDGLNQSKPFDGTYKLQLRDFNAPEQIYEEAFPSRIEFQNATFDFDGCSDQSGRPDAFVWPSLVRTGREAARLAAHRNVSAGMTGLSSPKRYLWKTEAQDKEWSFNAYRYQIPRLDPGEEEYTPLDPEFLNGDDVGGRAYARPVSDYINSSGDALFAGETDQNMLSKFSGKSTMTLMLTEIFLQAMMQMNSFRRRYESKHADSPRRLKTIILTTPPAMPEQEREIFRWCAYEALGIIWKCRGYDHETGDRNPFEFPLATQPERMSPPVPEVKIKWDEALACQIVYVYNESQYVFHGNGRDFIAAQRGRGPGAGESGARRPGQQDRFGECTREKIPGGNKEAELLGTRIASIDIGGGTTDLTVCDYYFRTDQSNQSGLIRPYELLHEGFKIAGADLLRDLIRNYVLVPLREHLVTTARSRPDVERVMAAVFGNGGAENNEQYKQIRQQITQQILIKLGYRLLEHLERLQGGDLAGKPASAGGTVGEFLAGRDRCVIGGQAVPDGTAFDPPDAQVTAFVDGQIGEIPQRDGKPAAPFSITDFRLEFDLWQIHRRLVTGTGFGLIKILDYLTAVVDTYQCDVLLLTGRPSKIPAVREHLLGSTRLAPARVRCLHDYDCSQWYPFVDGTVIGDPKTTVAVGALLACKKLVKSNLPDFKFSSSLAPAVSPIRYFGSVNKAEIMTAEEELYRYYDEAAPRSWPPEKPRYFRELPPDNQSNPERSPLREENEAAGAGKPQPGRVPQGNGTAKVGKPQHRTLPPTALPKDLGYRQFANPNYPATRLYRLEPYRRVEDLPSVQRAARLRYQPTVGTKDEVLAAQDAFLDALGNDEEAVNLAKPALDAWAAAVERDIFGQETARAEATRAEYTEKWRAEAQRLTAAASAGRTERSWHGWFGGQARREAELRAACERQTAELQRQHGGELDAALAQIRAEERDLAEAECRRATGRAAREHYRRVLERSRRGLEETLSLVDEQSCADFIVKLEIEYGICAIYGSGSKGKSLYRELESLNKQTRLADVLPQITTFRLAEHDGVKMGGDDYTDYFRMRLLTVDSEEDFWEDSGVIYTGTDL